MKCGINVQRYCAFPKKYFHYLRSSQNNFETYCIDVECYRLGLVIPTYRHFQHSDNQDLFGRWGREGLHRYNEHRWNTRPWVGIWHFTLITHHLYSGGSIRFVSSPNKIRLPRLVGRGLDRYNNHRWNTRTWVGIWHFTLITHHPYPGGKRFVCFIHEHNTVIKISWRESGQT